MKATVVIDRLVSSGHTDPDSIADLARKLTFERVTPSQVRDRIGKLEQWRRQVVLLGRIPQPAQRSQEWYDTRFNLITASDIAQSIGEGKFGTAREFLEKKCLPQSPFDANAPPLVWGIKYEPVANALYVHRTGYRVIEFGLLKHPELDYIGASPDGITEDGIMLEIKCPWRRAITGEVPKQYYYQVQAQLDVCRLEECDFLEISFSEYEDEGAFLEDCTGAEKGVLVEYIDGERRSYEYCDVGVPAGEMLEWRDSVLRCRPGGRPVYWRVEVFSVVRVTRDEEFVQAMYQSARRAWENVLRLRSDPAALEAELLAPKRGRAAPRKAPAKAFVLETSSDED